MLTKLYDKLTEETLRKTVPTDNTDKIIVRSNGINGAYSTISLANNNCQCFLYNLAIQNTLQSDEIIDKSRFNFIEENSVILYWPLDGTAKTSIIN
jgi:hypothetical protein